MREGATATVTVWLSRVYAAVFDEDIGDTHLYLGNSAAAVRFYDALAGRRGNTSYSEVTLTATVSDDPDIQPTGD